MEPQEEAWRTGPRSRGAKRESGTDMHLVLHSWIWKMHFQIRDLIQFTPLCKICRISVPILQTRKQNIKKKKKENRDQEWYRVLLMVPGLVNGRFRVQTQVLEGLAAALSSLYYWQCIMPHLKKNYISEFPQGHRGLRTQLQWLGSLLRHGFHPQLNIVG